MSNIIRAMMRSAHDKRQQEAKEEALLIRRARSGDVFARQKLANKLMREARERVADDQAEARYHGLAEKLKNLKAVPGWYLRLGRPPPSGKSQVRALPWQDLEESGVSVFAGTRLEGGHFLLDVPTLALRLNVVDLFLGDKKAYFVKGQRIGRGIDGEPILMEVSAMEPVPLTAIVAADPSSDELEFWNERRGGPLNERVPGLVAAREGG